MVKDRSWESVAGTNQAGPLIEERGNQVAESVRMRKGDDSEVHVIGTKAHRCTNIAAVSEEL